MFLTQAFGIKKRRKKNCCIRYCHPDMPYLLAKMMIPIQIFEMVNLADELLPLLPHGTISLPVGFDVFVKGSALKRSSAGSSADQDDSNSIANEVSAREKLLRDQPELLLQFGLDLLPVLIQVCCSGPTDLTCYIFHVDLFFFIPRTRFMDPV